MRIADEAAAEVTTAAAPGLVRGPEKNGDPIRETVGLAPGHARREEGRARREVGHGHEDPRGPDHPQRTVIPADALQGNYAKLYKSWVRILLVSHGQGI